MESRISTAEMRGDGSVVVTTGSMETRFNPKEWRSAAEQIAILQDLLIQLHRELDRLRRLRSD